jgi:ferredoxin
MKGIAVRRAGEAPPAGPARTPAHGEEPAVVAVEPGIEGMSAAYFHARAGRAVEVADSRQAVEERIAGELSGYRVPEGAIHADVERIAAAGVHFAGPARAPDTSAPDTPATVIRQSAPQPRPRIVELIAAGRARVPDAPGGEAGSRRAAAAALHGEEIRLKAGRRIPPGRGSDGEVAAVELSRCLECAAVCLKCVQVCPNRANTAVEARPGDGLRDRYQVVHLDEWCNDCGNCETFCPYEAQPYREKLTVFASEGRLAASPAPGFFLAADEVLVRARFEGPVARIERARLDGGRAGGGSSGDGGSGDGNGGRGDAERPVFMLIRRILADYPYLIPGGA